MPTPASESCPERRRCERLKLQALESKRQTFMNLMFRSTLPNITKRLEKNGMSFGLLQDRLWTLWFYRQRKVPGWNRESTLPSLCPLIDAGGDMPEQRQDASRCWKQPNPWSSPCLRLVLCWLIKLMPKVQVQDQSSKLPPYSMYRGKPPLVAYWILDTRC